jgi:hypothetical protein
MEVGQCPNWGRSAKEKNTIQPYIEANYTNTIKSLLMYRQNLMKTHFKCTSVFSYLLTSYEIKGRKYSFS